MKNSYGKPERVDKEFSTKGKEIMKERFAKGLAKFKPEDLSFAEFTRLTMRTPSWKNVENELKTMPKRENLI